MTITTNRENTMKIECLECGCEYEVELEGGCEFCGYEGEGC